VILCIIGGLIGLGVVYLGTIVFKAAADIKIVLDMNNAIKGVMISVTIGIISGIIPAYFAARMDPVEAIRSN
jgi:putative ABC transport system permease protein